MQMLLKESIKYILLLLVITACSGDKKNLNTPSENELIKNIGHAGSGFNYIAMPFNPYPPNGMSSLLKALKNDADGVEVDIQISSDYKLILYHDLTLDSKTDLTGQVASTPASVLIGKEYECGFPYDLFQNDHVISFRDWIDYAISLNPIPFLQLDLKTGYGESNLQRDSMLKLIRKELLEVKYPLEKVIIISNDTSVLKKNITWFPELATALEPEDIFNALKWAAVNNCKFLAFDYKDISPEIVNQVHAKGIGVIVFGGRSEKVLAKIVNMKPDYIQSNNVELLEEILNPE